MYQEHTPQDYTGPERRASREINKSNSPLINGIEWALGIALLLIIFGWLPR